MADLDRQQLDPSEENLRLFMRSVPSPVVIITAANPTCKRGFTVGSFCSVSLNPVLVSFNISRVSRMYEVISDTSEFAVHLLSRDQESLADHFARPGLSEDEQFGGLAIGLSSDGSPLLQESHGILICAIEQRIQAGDHDIVVGRVTSMELDVATHVPLVYHHRSYAGVKTQP